MVNPCCCTSLQKGVKIVAVISFLWTIALISEEILLVALKGCSGIELIKDQNPEFGDVQTTDIQAVHDPVIPPILHKSSVNQSRIVRAVNNHTHTKHADYNYEEEDLADELRAQTAICKMKVQDVIVSAVWVLTWIFDLALAVVLLYGAFKKSIKLCSIWFHIRCAILVFRIIFLIIYVITGLPFLYKVPVLVLCLFRIYSLWVVSHFIDELKHEREARQKPRVSMTTPSSKQDLEKFANVENVPAPPGLTPLW